MDDPLAVIGGVFDERAPTYDESTMHRAVAAAVAEFVDLEGVGVVLDAATGTGLVLRAIARRAPELRLIGVDISPGMLAIAQAELSTAEWCATDASTIPLPDGSVDLITCVTALHIIPDVDRAAAEWRRVLRGNGRLVTASFASTPPAVQVPPGPYRRDHAPYASVDALAATFRAFGFSLSRHTGWTDQRDTLLLAEMIPTSG